MKLLFVRPWLLLPMLFLLSLVGCKTKSPELIQSIDTIYIAKYHTDTLRLHTSSHSVDTVSIYRAPDSVYIYHRSVTYLSSDTTRSRVHVDTVFRNRDITVALPSDRHKSKKGTWWLIIPVAVSLIALYFWLKRPKM